MNAPVRSRSTAFTLIELMVVVGIIALLIAILIPSFKAVSTNAKSVTTKARIGVLERGLESFRGESALGGAYPPSQGDQLQTGGPNGSLLTMKNPLVNPPNEAAVVNPITGANLLVYGLVGADQLGTPGFPDLNSDGAWWDNQHAAPPPAIPGAYALSPSNAANSPMLPLVPRYPSGGATFVDEPTRGSIRTLLQLEANGTVLPKGGLPDSGAEGTGPQPYFTDAWQHPILYYRANRGASFMASDPGANIPIGTYDHRDNAFVTGAANAVDCPGGMQGFDFGQGAVVSNGPYFSRIMKTVGMAADPTIDPQAAANEFSFEQFIHDKSVKARNVAVNKDKFLLISAGSDAIYGTSDDVVNWTRD